jgi:hypothetical protein
VLVNTNIGDPLFAGFGGATRIEVSGAAVSIVHEWIAGLESVFPAASVARTSKSWEPAVRPV